jgi:spore germination cell wall hydrolase CwlJ-like protein
MLTPSFCLALILYGEASTQTEIVQNAVGYVVMNRAKYNPDKICEVTHKPGAFHYITQLKQGVKKYPSELVLAQYRHKAYRIIHNYASNPVGDANYFHDTSINKPKYWKVTYVAKYDKMIFYKGEYNGR